jgi:hypothetical protein
MLCAHLGRFLTYDGHFDEANKFLGEAHRIGRRLDLQPVLLATKAARGRWLCDSRKSDESAVWMLEEVASAIHSLDDEPLFTKVDPLRPESTPTSIKGRHPILCRVLLDLNRAARFADDVEVMNQTLDELDGLTTEVFSGYRPHYCLAAAECLLTHATRDAVDQRERTADLIREAREMGELSRNPWVAKAADRLERHAGSRP